MGVERRAQLNEWNVMKKSRTKIWGCSAGLVSHGASLKVFKQGMTWFETVSGRWTVMLGGLAMITSAFNFINLSKINISGGSELRRWQATSDRAVEGKGVVLYCTTAGRTLERGNGKQLPRSWVSMMDKRQICLEERLVGRVAALEKNALILLVKVHFLFYELEFFEPWFGISNQSEPVHVQFWKV